jgi:DNA polymerase sigma
MLKPEREWVLSRIAEMCTKSFPGENPHLEVFGSLVTGLALESSDMDLAVTGLHIGDRELMIADLHTLAHGLQNWQCLESFKAIDTASIPVIKMVIRAQ